jgi:hypothetical protein
MGNDQPALRALLACLARNVLHCESGLSDPEIWLGQAFVLLSFDLEKEAHLQKQLL